MPDRLRERGALLRAYAGHPARRDTQGGSMSAELDRERRVLSFPGEAAIGACPEPGRITAGTEGGSPKRP